MGRWLEVVRERIPDELNFLDYRRSFIVGEISPNALLSAAECLGRHHRTSFPTLDWIRIDSGAWVDDFLWLEPAVVGHLLDEFRRLRRICDYQEFLPGLDGARVKEYWSRLHTWTDFECYLNDLETLLTVAVQNNYWVILWL